MVGKQGFIKLMEGNPYDTVEDVAELVKSGKFLLPDGAEGASEGGNPDTEYYYRAYYRPMTDSALACASFFVKQLWDKIQTDYPDEAASFEKIASVSTGGDTMGRTAARYVSENTKDKRFKPYKSLSSYFGLLWDVGDKFPLVKSYNDDGYAQKVFATPEGKEFLTEKLDAYAAEWANIYRNG